MIKELYDENCALHSLLVCDMPAKFVMDHLFGRANIALASAGSVVLLLGVLVLAAPWWYWRARSGGVAR